MSQFSTTRSNIGDLNIEPGVIIDITAATTGVFSIAQPNGSQGIPDDQGVSSDRPAPRFVGGSSRNMVIETKINDDIPSGWFKQIEKYKWASEVGEFTVEVAADGGLTWSDATDIIMTAPPGSIPLDDRITCTTFASSGSTGNREFIVDLGSATGLVTLEFDAYGVPDIFIVEYNGVEVINTGYRGTSGTYDTPTGSVAVTVAGPGAGTASFTKTTAAPSLATIRVEAPFVGTQWDVNLGCPAAGSPPYVVPGNVRSTFTATSTAYGDTLNGGTPFTLDVVYEGGASYTFIELVSEPLAPFLSGNLVENTPTRWTDYYFNVTINSAGDAIISDMEDVIAIRPTVIGEELYLDPSGSYEATTYGKDTYNNGVEFSASVAVVITPPLELYTYLKLAVSAGSVTAVTGPFSAPTLPANTAGVNILPLSYSDGLGKVIQYQDGAILWKGAAGSTPFVSKTANYTILLTDSTINCTANSFTVTLPTAVGIAGQAFNIKNSGTGVITIATTSSQTIDEYLSAAIILPQYTNLTVMSNGSNWLIL